MQGAEQRLRRRGLSVRGVALEPGIDRRQVAGHFRVEDLQQQGVHRRRDHFHGRGRRLRRLPGIRGHGLRCGASFGVGGEARVRGGRGGGDLACQGAGRREARVLRHRLVAGRDAVGRGLHALEVGAHGAGAAQRGLEFRQGVEGLVDHGDHRRARRARAVEHAVEHVLDLPAELAQGARADEATASLQGVEDAADRAQALEVVGLRPPQRQQLVEVVDLFGELLEEHLADLVVDLVAGGLEAAGPRRRGRGRLGCGVGCRGRPGRAAVDQRRHRAFDIGLAHHRRRCFDRRGLALGHALRGQRPVAQAFEALAAHVEDLVAVETVLPQRLEVVLQARQRIGEGVQLAPVGDAPAVDERVLDVAPDAGEVGRRLRQLEHLQRARDLPQQARDLDQLGVVPARLDEGDEGLAGVREIGDRLACEDVEDLAGLAGGQLALHRGVLVAGAEAGDLVVEGGVDVQQRAGDVEQRAFVGRATALDDLLHGLALLLDHAARDAEPQHAQGVGDATERLDLRRKAVELGFARAQVQVERVLHPQQVLLDRGGHGVEQRAVAAAHAALGVADLGVGRELGLQLEGVVQRPQRGMVGAGVRDVVEELAGRLQRGFRARDPEAVVLEQAARLALDAGEGLAQRGRRRERAVGHGPGHRGRHPEHAPRGLGVDLAKERIERTDQGRAVAGRASLRPRGHRFAQVRQQRLRAGVAHRQRVVGQLGRRQGVGKRALQVRREQHALREAGLAADGTQVVEQRQQDDRDVLVAALQSLEVIGQQDDAAHEHRAGGVAVGHRPFLQRLRQPLHLLGDHRRRIQLDHAQRALHLVQVTGAEAHATGVGRVGGEVLDLDPRLAQGLVELRLDPAERRVVDGVAQSGHRSGVRPAA